MKLSKLVPISRLAQEAKFNINFREVFHQRYRGHTTGILLSMIAAAMQSPGITVRKCFPYEKRITVAHYEVMIMQLLGKLQFDHFNVSADPYRKEISITYDIYYTDTALRDAGIIE